MPGTVHVIGAGLAGLAAAVRLAQAGRSVAVYEAAGQAGGRCRSYHDPALDMVIDNGNHLLLSANHAALSYLEAIGAAGGLAGPDARRFCIRGPCKRRTVDACASMPAGCRWWMLDKKRRVPGTAAGDYLAFARLLLRAVRQDDLRDAWTARVRFTSAWRDRCGSPRSTPTRRRRAPASPVPSCARRWPPAARPVGR